MIKGKLIFKTREQAGKVCMLLNEIKDAEYYKREYDFHRINKALVYRINEKKDQEKLDKMIKKLKSR